MRVETTCCENILPSHDYNCLELWIRIWQRVMDLDQIGWIWYRILFLEFIVGIKWNALGTFLFISGCQLFKADKKMETEKKSRSNLKREKTDKDPTIIFLYYLLKKPKYLLIFTFLALKNIYWIKIRIRIPELIKTLSGSAIPFQLL